MLLLFRFAVIYMNHAATSCSVKPCGQCNRRASVQTHIKIYFVQHLEAYSLLVLYLLCPVCMRSQYSLSWDSFLVQWDTFCLLRLCYTENDAALVAFGNI